ncbi:MAG: DsrE family protein [Bacteroidota bacterium]
MKRILFVLWLTWLSFGFAYAQDQSYKVVFDLTSRDSLDQKAVMRWIKEISASNPEAEMEVVMYAKGFELVMPEKSTVIDDVKEALKNPNVTFKVCEVALKNNKVDKGQLLKEVGTVPDGIYEIVMKQQQGWGYIKVIH